MRHLLRRLACLLVGHTRVKTITDVELRSFGLMSGPLFDIKAAHWECRRCGRLLNREAT